MKGVGSSDVLSDLDAMERIAILSLTLLLKSQEVVDKEAVRRGLTEWRGSSSKGKQDMYIVLINGMK